MIEAGTMPDAQEKYISINLSDNKHRNRIIDFYEEKNIITDEFQCSIKVHWTDDKHHPVMQMKKNDFLKFVQELNYWAENIK